MNKVSLILFLILCVLFLTHGIYQGVAQDQWTSLTIAIIIVVMGSYSMIRKNRQ